MSNKKIECAMLFPNTMNTKSIVVGQSMEEIKREVEYKKDKVQVILQFPESSDRAKQIKKEVTEILKKELQKQMKNRKEVVCHEENTDAIEGQFKSAVGSRR